MYFACKIKELGPSRRGGLFKFVHVLGVLGVLGFSTTVVTVLLAKVKNARGRIGIFLLVFYMATPCHTTESVGVGNDPYMTQQKPVA